MIATTGEEVRIVHSPDRLFEMFLHMTEEEFLILWKWGGYGGHPPQNVDRRIVAMVKGMTPRARREVARAFVRAFTSLSPKALAALVAFLLALVNRPAGIALPTPAPRALASQRRCHRLTPARAP